jgi:hypothetical protein
MFKRTLLAVSLLTLSGSVLSDCKSPLLDNYLQPTGHTNLIQCKSVPNYNHLTLFLIPSDLNPDSDIDVDILLVNQSGTIESMVHSPKYLSKDTFETSIDTANYKLNENRRAFGINVNMGNYVNRDLYIIEGQDIRLIAQGIGVELSGEDATIKRTIDIGKMDKSGYADLIVKENKTKYTLKYNETTGMYDVPNSLRYSF